MALLLFMAGDGRRRGYRHVLDAFWDEAKLAGIPLPTEEPVSAPSFCTARVKVSPEFIRSLVHAANMHFDAKYRADSRWRGRRVLAADGSGLNLRRSDELFQTFGGLETAYSPQAQISVLLNVVSKVPVDVAIGRYKTAEQSMLVDQHIPCALKKGDIFVLDRGYTGFPVYEALRTAGADFVARVPSTGTFNAIQEFARSGGQDRSVPIAPTRRAKTDQPLLLRVIRSKRTGSEDVFIVTSLRKEDGYSRADIEALYKMRWEVEEHFKAFKSAYMGQGQLHSKTSIGVRQEILAAALFHSLSNFLMASAARHVGDPYNQLSTKSACLGLSDYIVRLFVCHDPRANEWLTQLLLRIARTRDKKRPGRSHPRRSFKPHNRWGPRGPNRA